MGTARIRPSAAIALFLALACSDQEERPPVASDCNEPPCVEVRAGATTMSVVALLPEPGGGEAGSGGSGNPPPSQLQGSVRRIVEPDLFGTDPPNAAVEIRAPGANGTVVVAGVAADGSFSMPGVLPQEQAWVAVGNFTDPPSGTFMDTYQRVNTAVQQPVELAVMQQTVMEQIAQGSFFETPRQLQNDRGHAIVQFIDEFGAPVIGVSLTYPTADDAGIAYDSGDLYSDLLTETSVRGTVVLLNLSAAPYPGGSTSIVAHVTSLPDREFRSDLRVTAGSLTLYTLQLQL
jgi:hypothetical protein